MALTKASCSVKVLNWPAALLSAWVVSSPIKSSWPDNSANREAKPSALRKKLPRCTVEAGSAAKPLAEAKNWSNADDRPTLLSPIKSITRWL